MCGVQLIQESEREEFFFQTVSQANRIDTNAPPLKPVVSNGRTYFVDSSRLNDRVPTTVAVFWTKECV